MHGFIRKNKFYSAILPFGIIFLFVFSAKFAIAQEGHYDLALESITFNPEKPRASSTCSITIALKNNGTLPIISEQSIINYEYSINNFDLIDLSHTPVSTQHPLVPGGYVYYVFKGIFSSIGSSKVVFSIDASNFLSESNEDNNKIERSVSPVGSKDLVADSITVKPAVPALDQKAVITVKVKNGGADPLVDYTGLQDYIYDFSGFLTSNIETTAVSGANPVKPGGFMVYTYTGSFTRLGTTTLDFKADGSSLLAESNENNNEKKINVSVVSPEESDITVSSITFSPIKPIVNEEVEIKAVIKNVGKTTFFDAIGFRPEDIQYSFSNFEKKSESKDAFPDDVNQFAPGALFTYSWKGRFIAGGKQKFGIKVNAYGRLQESNSVDNATSTEKLVYQSVEERDNFNILSQKAISSGTSSAVVCWTADALSTGEVYYTDVAGAVPLVKTADAKNVLEHCVKIIKLRPKTKYYYRIKAKNGTVIKAGESAEFVTMSEEEMRYAVQPKIMTDDKIGKFTANWTMSFYSTGYFYYRKGGAGKQSALTDPVQGLEHTASTSQLASGEYEGWSVSKNDEGFSLKSEIVNFKINYKPVLSSIPKASSTTAQSAKTIAPTSIVGGSGAVKIKNLGMFEKLKGRIIMRANAGGEAYYVDPGKKMRFFLGRPADAFKVMREQGIWISNGSLASIQVGLIKQDGADTDKDGLADMLEDAIGTDKLKGDTDGDGHKDKDEISSGYSPVIKGKKENIDNKFSASQAGKILLQVEGRGEAWFVDPKDNKRYFLGRPADAFAAMRALGLGINEADFGKL
jgi:hypothetical protein